MKEFMKESFSYTYELFKKESKEFQIKMIFSLFLAASTMILTYAISIWLGISITRLFTEQEKYAIFAIVIMYWLNRWAIAEIKSLGNKLQNNVWKE